MFAGFICMALASVSAGLIDRMVDTGCTINESLTIEDKLFRVCANLSIDNSIFFIPVFLLTLGEVLINISGLNFTYVEVGKRTKSFASALWLLTSCIGAQISAQLIPALGYGKTIDQWVCIGTNNI
jgi:dipeptide/tripeptide permease